MKILLYLTLAFGLFQLGCMGDPSSAPVTGGFVGVAPIQTKPNTSMAPTGTFIQSAGGVSTSLHTQMRMGMGDSFKATNQVATSAHTSVYLNIQTDIHSNNY